MTLAVTHTSAIATRHVRTFIRQPWWIAISLMQPLIYLLLFGQLFQTVGDLPAFHGSYLDFLLPGVVAMSALSSGGWAGMTSIDDIGGGIMSRMLVTPASRSAIIFGHLAQGALILILQTLILVGVGVLIGARFDGGLTGVAIMLMASLLLGSATGALSHGIGLLARTRETLIAVSGDRPADDFSVDHLHGPAADARLDGHRSRAQPADLGGRRLSIGTRRDRGRDVHRPAAWLACGLPPGQRVPRAAGLREVPAVHLGAVCRT
jgi:hypothetical protein